MKSLLLITSLTLAGTTGFGQVKPEIDSSFNIYLLAGQSNMAGRAPLDTLSKEVDPQILMLDKDNNWVPATDPVHFDKPEVAGVKRHEKMEGLEESS